jgi:deoxyxylulose-5-phosphate synthase
MEACRVRRPPGARQPHPHLRLERRHARRDGGKTQSENTAARFKAIGWDVQTLADGHDLAAILKAINKAKKAKSGKPQLIIAKTIIGKGIPEVQGTRRATARVGRSSPTPRAPASACRPTSIST